MDATTVSLVVGLATVLASGVVSSIVTYRLNRRKDQQVFLRQKAEELYLAADEFGRRFDSQSIGYFPLFEGKIDWNAMLDLQIEQNSRAWRYGGGETMTMLAEIYFPSTRPLLQSIWDARSQYNRVTGAIKQFYVENGHVEDSRCAVLFREASLAMTRAVGAFKKEVIVAARETAGVKQDAANPIAHAEDEQTQV